MEQQERRHFWARKYLIYPRFQLILMALQFVITAGAFLVVVILTRSSYAYIQQQALVLGVNVKEPYLKLVEAQEHLIYTYLAIALFIAFLGGSLGMLLISHRVAGPIHRLKEHLRGIINGQAPSAIQFRKGDFISDLPDLVNQALNKRN